MFFGWLIGVPFYWRSIFSLDEIKVLVMGVDLIIPILLIINGTHICESAKKVNGSLLLACYFCAYANMWNSKKPTGYFLGIKCVKFNTPIFRNPKYHFKFSHTGSCFLVKRFCFFLCEIDIDTYLSSDQAIWNIDHNIFSIIWFNLVINE